jgi:uncharacterized membrane protein
MQCSVPAIARIRTVPRSGATADDRDRGLRVARRSHQIAAEVPMSDRSLAPKVDRLPAVDFVRGLVMVLMTIDHASGAFNRGRLMVDGAATFSPDMALEPVQFVVRWVTHLCAPTFVLLAGVSLALSVTRRLRAGIESSVIDRDILIRGALLIALEVGWMGWMWRLGLPVQLGVLYAVGVSMIGLIALRRLPPAVVGALGVAVFAFGEAVMRELAPAGAVGAAALLGGPVGPGGLMLVLYPFLPWAGFLMIGWALGTRVADGAMQRRDWLVLAAIACAVFVIVRGANGYGNAGLLRRDGSWVEWLHVSKYPPCLAYAGLELSIAFLLLGLAWRAQRLWSPLVVLGQTALFYYLIHAHLLKGTALALGAYRTQGVGVTLLATAVALVALAPVCRWYLGVKRRHPRSVLRFV